MIPQIRKLLEVVAAGVSDRETTGELIRVIDNPGRWREAQDLFGIGQERVLAAVAG